MTDRTLPWGDPPNQNYTTGEGGSDPPDGNFVVAETGAGAKLMEWDATASEWVVRGDVNASGQAVSVGSLDATSVNTAQGTVDGDEMVGVPSSGTGVSATIGGGWTVEDADRPIILEIRLKAVTDGSTEGDVRLEVDEDGNNTADLVFGVWADPAGGSGYVEFEHIVVVVPAGGQIRLRNSADPNDENTVQQSRKYVL